VNRFNAISVVGGMAFARESIARTLLGFNDGDWPSVRKEQSTAQSTNSFPCPAGSLATADSPDRHKFLDHLSRRRGPSGFRQLLIYALCTRSGFSDHSLVPEWALAANCS
jgi:hypothetical protein